MKMKKWIVGAVLALSLAFTTQVYAEDNYYSAHNLSLVEKDNFDYEWYLEQHPDLAAIFSVQDTDAIWDFYENVGEPAGWYGRRSVISRIAPTHGGFDYERYAQDNPDVVAVYGNDEKLLTEHFLTVGFAEGRKGYSKDNDSNAQVEIYRLAEEITAGCNSNREKIKAVHDWMCENIDYDYKNYLAGTIPWTSYYESGAIFNHKAVCNGYALTFRDFMDVLGIECDYVKGDITYGDGKWLEHAWNRVKLDNQWYYIDVTWDAPVRERGDNPVTRYKYYLTTDSTFGGDHR